MAKKPSPSLVAHKVINLTCDLSSSEKRVSALLIDSFNFKTGQCDPGVDTIARLLNLSVRTVVRATNALAQKGYFRKVRNGSYFRRNRYEPNWARFQLQEEAWATHRRATRFKKNRSDLSSPMGQQCHFERDKTVTQTNPTKQIPETSEDQKRPPSAPQKRLMLPRERVGGLPSFSPSCALDDMTRRAIAETFDVFAQRIGVDVFQAWFASVSIEGICAKDFTISAPTAFIRSRIERDYAVPLEKLVCARLSEVSRLRVTVGKQSG